MKYSKNSLRTLMISSTALAVGIAPVTAAPARLPDRPSLNLVLADMITILPNQGDPQSDGWIVDVGVCDDEDDPEPEPEPTPDDTDDDDGGDFDDVDFNPIFSDDIPLIMVHCHDNDRAEPFNPDTVERMIAEIERTSDDCAQLDKGFRIDCLAAKYEEIALSLPNSGDQKIVKSALNTAARKLRRIVRQNADPAVPKTRFALQTPDGATKPITSRPLRAIKPAAQEQANAAAAVVIDELSTKLLRSSENSARRQEYFVGVAQAVDSNKVLLRS